MSHFAPVLLFLVFLVQAPAGWEATFDKGTRLLLDDKPAEAIALFAAVVNKSPTFPDAERWLAESHAHAARGMTDAPQAAARRQHFEAAAVHFRRYLELEPAGAPLALTGLVDIYRLEGLNQPAEAEAFARQLVAARPMSVVWHNNLAEVLVEQKRYADAAAAMHQGRAVVTDDRLTLAAAMVNLMIRHEDITGAPAKSLGEDALAILNEEIKKDGKNRDVYMFKSGALTLLAERAETNPGKQKSLQEESSKAFEVFHNMNPGRESPTADPPAGVTAAAVPPGWKETVARANGFLEQKQYPEAMAVYQQFITAYPKFPGGYYMQMDIQLAAGKPAAVDALFKTAREALPLTTSYRNAMANYLLEIEFRRRSLSPDQARKLLNEALSLSDAVVKASPSLLAGILTKSMVLGRLAELEKDPKKAKAFRDEMDQLTARARQLSIK